MSQSNQASNPASDVYKNYENEQTWRVKIRTPDLKTALTCFASSPRPLFQPRHLFQISNDLLYILRFSEQTIKPSSNKVFKNKEERDLMHGEFQRKMSTPPSWVIYTISLLRALANLILR